MMGWKSRITMIFLAVIVVVCAIGYVWSGWIDTYTIEGKVLDKFIDHSKEGSHYVVVLVSNQKLEVKRNLWYSGSEYNEDVLYAQIKVNGTYKFTCWGWQLDVYRTYWYANIISVERLD